MSRNKSEETTPFSISLINPPCSTTSTLSGSPGGERNSTGFTKPEYFNDHWYCDPSGTFSAFGIVGTAEGFCSTTGVAGTGKATVGNTGTSIRVGVAACTGLPQAARSNPITGMIRQLRWIVRFVYILIVCISQSLFCLN